MREREKGKEAITVLYPLAEIKPSQLVATESKDIPATVGTVDLVLSLSVLVPFIVLLKCECILIPFSIVLIFEYYKSSINRIMFVDLYFSKNAFTYNQITLRL